MKRLARLALAFLFATMVACDGGVILHGELVDPSGKEMESCRLNLYSKPEDELLDSISVQGRFDELITVSPWLRRCYAVVSCRGAQDAFRSQVYEVGSEPLDLGRITFKRTAP